MEPNHVHSRLEVALSRSAPPATPAARTQGGILAIDLLGDLVATAGADHSVQLFDRGAERVIASLNGHAKRVTGARRGGVGRWGGAGGAGRRDGAGAGRGRAGVTGRGGAGWGGAG